MTEFIEVPIHGNAVTQALRNLHRIHDLDGMRKLFHSKIEDELLIEIGSGDKKIVGDSQSGFKVVKA